jgi:hypothetical protein
MPKQPLEAEQILINHGIGETIQPREEGWDKKKALYQREKLWSKYCNLRSDYAEQFTSPKDGFIDKRLANKIAQKVLDNQLFAAVRGTLPTEKELNDPADDQLVSRDIFGTTADAELDNLTVIDYIFNNIGFKMEDCKPEDAPCPGAYFYLVRLKENTDASNEFYRNVWTKTIPSKSVIEDARKRNDDGRDTFKVLDRLRDAYGTDQTEVSAL